MISYVPKRKDSVIFKAIKPNERGFFINLTFTKNQEEHDKAMEAIKQFFIREIL